MSDPRDLYCEDCAAGSNESGWYLATPTEETDCTGCGTVLPPRRQSAFIRLVRTFVCVSCADTEVGKPGEPPEELKRGSAPIEGADCSICEGAIRPDGPVWFSDEAE